MSALAPRHLIWLDLETTGLDPEKDQVLEVAAFGVSFETPFALREVTDVHAVLQHLDWHEVPERVRAMHIENGLVVECLRSVKTAAELDTALAGLAARCTWTDPQNSTVLARPALAGSSVHFDKGFCRTRFPKFHERLHHRVYDVSAVKLFCLSQGMPEPERTKPAHRTIDDIHGSVEIAKQCAQWLRDEYHWKAGPK